MRLKSGSIFHMLLSVVLVTGACADPTFNRLGVFELAHLGSVALLGFFGVFTSMMQGVCRLPIRNSVLTTLTLGVLALFLISGVIGVHAGAPPVEVGRSTAPFLVVWVCVLAWALSPVRVSTRFIALSLLGAGVVQAVLVLAVFTGTISGAGGVISADAPQATGDVRITLVDRRMTLPLVVAGAAAGVALALRRQRLSACLLWLAGASICVVAAAVTQTRSQLGGALLGVAVVLVAGVLFGPRYCARTEPISRVLYTILPVGAGVAVAVLAIPELREPIQGLWDRLQAGSDSNRLKEWLPALAAWSNGGVVELLFGIGAGEAIETAGGERRTYTHNILLSFLVFKGMVGLVFIITLAVGVVYGLLRRWREQEDECALGLMAAFVGILGYAMFFVMHKLVITNVIFAVLVLIAMERRQRAAAPMAFEQK